MSNSSDVADSTLTLSNSIDSNLSLIPVNSSFNSSTQASSSVLQSSLAILNCAEEHIDSSSIKGDKKGKKEYVVVSEEGSASDLLQRKVSSDDEAFELYNNYAFRHGFGVRKGKTRYRVKDGSLCMRQFVCWCCGFKSVKNVGQSSYSKADYRTGCKAFVQFHVDENGVFTLVTHFMGHNHEMVPLHERHRIRSHRSVQSEQLSFISNLKFSGIPVADAIRVMRKEAGGSPNLGFIASDAYNALAAEKLKRIDFSDSNQLIKYFSERQANEVDFYYDVQLDSDGHLVNFFFRDSRMKRDYLIFGDVVIHDTTHRTNKYELICGLFVGMNHHTNNVMFGCAFLLNEQTESFIWLFETFLRSMGGKMPVTFMTDQCAAMASAISVVFPSVSHRLCTWHIGENSKKNIPGLRAKDDFIDVFNTVLKYSDTVAEFEFYWKGMMEQFECSTSKWLNDLYLIKEKWCSAYSKKIFSGGILSSQRCETTNRSVKRRLCKTHDLCDFYHLFLDVIGEWRSRENGENFNCRKGNRHLAAAHLNLLEHASQVYTIEVYKIFEEEFLKGTECSQQVRFREHPIVIYHVSRPEVDLIMHQVGYHELTHEIECTCNYFTEVGLLCFHCLRVYHLHCVPRIPDRYVLLRWTRSVMCGQNEEAKAKDSNAVSSSVWRAEMTRSFVRLINASQSDPSARHEVELGYATAKEKVETILGKISNREVEEDVASVSSRKVCNPKKRRKYESNSRPKSIIEKKCNQAKGWRKKAAANALKVKNNAQTAMKKTLTNVFGSNLVHPSDSSSELSRCGVDDYFGVTVTSIPNS